VYYQTWRARCLRPGPGLHGDELVPIPGTKRIKWLEQNLDALDITLTPGDLAALDPLASQVTGPPY
jgi:aryl-alcohol dehydrogenase-like predicted oxidoreductase